MITKNNQHLFSQYTEKEKSRTVKLLMSLKRDCNMFSTLYISNQVCDADLEDFFQHKNQSFPSSLSDYGKMRLGTKSDQLQCLEDLVPDSDNTDSLQPEVDMVVIDGATIINMIMPGMSETFNDYATEEAVHIRRQFTGSVHHVDMVFDVYRAHSLRTATRKKRGKGTQRRAEGQKKLPGNWLQFLLEDGNKTELFKLLSE